MSEGIKSAEDKMATIKYLHVHRSLGNVQCFFSIMNLYKRCIWDCSKIYLHIIKLIESDKLDRT
jgi:hypothetical protein